MGVPFSKLIQNNVEYDVVDREARLGIKEKNIVIIGNSYVGNGVADKLKTLFKHNYVYTVGGGGFVNYTGHTSNYVDALDNAIADTSFANDTITDVIFISAMGDTRAYTEFSDFDTKLTSAFSAIQAKISANFTNCTRVMLSFAESRDTAYFSDNPYNALFDVHRKFKTYCTNYGIEYLGWSGFNSLFKNEDFESDHYHPSAVGANRIGSFIKNSYFGVIEYAPIVEQKSCSVKYSGEGSVTVVARFTPDECTFYVRGITMPTGAVTLNANDRFVRIDELNIPLPVPSVAPDLVCQLVNTSGAIIDTLTLTLQKNAYGVGSLFCVVAPHASTNASGAIYIPNLNVVTYLIA